MLRERALGRWLTVIVMHIFLSCVGGVGGPFEGVRWPLGLLGTPYAGLKEAQLDANVLVLAHGGARNSTRELVRGTLLARAAEALAMNQDDV